MTKKVIAGNWKMNCDREEASALLTNLSAESDTINFDSVEMIVCPPAIWLVMAKDYLSGTGISIGAQDCHAEESGAFTGDLSAKIIKSSGANHVILGHSERRHGAPSESSSLIKSKAEKALKSGLKVILCIGETEEQYDSGQTADVVKKQLVESMPGGANSDNVIVAYEPVWAIGTGKTATVEGIEAVHKVIDETLSKEVDPQGQWRILYGGSVKPENAGEILAAENVAGVLVGGASLKAQSFSAIARAV